LGNPGNQKQKPLNGEEKYDEGHLEQYDWQSRLRESCWQERRWHRGPVVVWDRDSEGIVLHGKCLRGSGRAGTLLEQSRIVEKLKLTDVQRKEFDDIFLQHREKLIDLRASLQKAELGAGAAGARLAAQ